jgi:hypothetical protein
MALIPVDYDPFATEAATPSADQRLIPVDYDPFATAAAPQQLSARGVRGAAACCAMLPGALVTSAADPRPKLLFLLPGRCGATRP